VDVVECRGVGEPSTQCETVKGFASEGYDVSELIAVTAVRSGPWPTLRYSLTRILGLTPCPLKALSHGVFRPSPSWRACAQAIENDFGHSLIVVATDRADEAVRKASSGREPCVLIRDAEGGVSMIVDWNDLIVAKGNVDVFERILRSKLLMY